ncbi:MAG: hypothetical protein J6T43_06260 [Prevotella sp.]|nr:hypothetical protein [Prevotella sp.]
MNIEQYDPAVAQQQSQASVSNEGGNKKGSSRKWWIALILIGVLILFAVTTPDKYAHKEAINTEVSSAVTSSLVGKVGSWAVLGNIVVSKIVDLTLDSNIDVDNYLVFSLAKAELEGKKRVLSVGALNHVWVLFEKRDLEGLIDTEVNTLWQNFVGSIPGLGREESRTPDVAIEKAEEPQATTPLDSNTVRRSANDIIDNAIEDVSSEVEKALERGVSKAIDGILKDLLGTGTGSGQ